MTMENIELFCDKFFVDSVSVVTKLDINSLSRVNDDKRLWERDWWMCFINYDPDAWSSGHRAQWHQIFSFLTLTTRLCHCHPSLPTPFLQHEYIKSSKSSSIWRQNSFRYSNTELVVLDGLVHDDSKIAGSVSSSDADHEHCVVFMIFMSSKIADQIMEFLAELGWLESGEYSYWSQPSYCQD